MTLGWRALIALALISTLATVSGIARAGSSIPPREERVPYTAGQGSVFGVDTERGVFVASVTIQIGKERFLKLEVDDSTGTQIAGAIMGDAGLIENFCGSTDKPVRVQPFQAVEISLLTGICEDGTPSVTTQGELIAKLYK